MVNKYTSFLN